MPYLFDGYNVYHAARKLTEQWSDITSIALCRLIGQDMCYLRDWSIVVFDGSRPRGRPADVDPAKHIKIIYSGHDSDADVLLEELIEKNTAPRRLTVVSTDRQVRKATRRRRAKSLTSREYLEFMIKRSQRPAPPPPEPREKRHGLPEGQLDQWLELFGIDPE
jgi:uncharacterized protein